MQSFDVGRLAVFTTVYIALATGHTIGDHWVQTEAQARGKGSRDRAGMAACGRHVATLTATKATALAVTVCVLHPVLHVPGLVAGFAVDAVSHYFADRRYTLARLAELTGHREFFRLGAPRPGHDDNPSLGTGAYVQDQSWHYLWLWAAALIISA